MSKAKFPLDALFTSITAVSQLVRDAIPSDELRQQQFDENEPIRRLKQLKQLLRQSKRYFRQNHLTINEVDEFCKQIKQDEDFATLLRKELTK